MHFGCRFRKSNTFGRPRDRRNATNPSVAVKRETPLCQVDNANPHISQERIQRPAPGCRHGFLDDRRAGEAGRSRQARLFLERTTNVCGCGQLRRRGAPNIPVPWPAFRLSKKGCRGRERRQVGVGGTAARRFAKTRANRSFQGQTDENESRTLRTEMQTATFRSFVRTGLRPVLPGAVQANPPNRRRGWQTSRSRGATGSPAWLRSRSGRRTGRAAAPRFSPRAQYSSGQDRPGGTSPPVLPARAVQFLVEDPRPRPLATQGSHDEAGVEAARTRQPLRDHPPRPAPRRSGPVTEVAEPPRRRAGRDAAAARLAQLSADALRQAGVAGQAEQVVDPIVFAPRPVAAKAAVAANDDFGLRPTLANALPRQLLRRARCRVDVRRPQPRTQNQVIPHNVERKVAVRVVVAVEVTPLLVAMHRVVGGVDVQKDLAATDKRRGTGRP